MIIASGWTSVSLEQPGYLVVLVVLPLIALLSVRSLAGLGAFRRPLAIALRCAFFGVLVFALAAPEWVRPTDDQTVIFAVDASDSVPAERQLAAHDFLTAASKSMRPGQDRVAVVQFGGRAAVEQLPHESIVAELTGDARDPYQTDISAALRLGLALSPPDSAKRLVLLSDGNENRGVAAHEADALAALGIPIDVVPLRYAHDAEILVEQLIAPARAKLDEAVNLQLIVRSLTATTARLRFYRDGRLVDLDPKSSAASIPIELSEGPNRFAIPVELNKPGVHRFRAEVLPDDPTTDGIAVNNEGQAFTIVGEAERVVIVTGLGDDEAEADSTEILADAIRAGGIECSIMPLAELSDDPASLTDTAAVILSNVSAFALGDARQAMLASYVRDQGGGLIAVGGDEAFSVGGYAHTPLEEIMPVETARSKLKMLSLAMVVVVDRSGSMCGEKITLACQAAVGAVELLSRADRIGVIAFNSGAETIVPLQSAEHRFAITNRILNIGAGGGTDMYPALEGAYEMLRDVDTNIRHIIVLTDGQSASGNFEGLARKCAEQKITISTIAVGPDADRGLLARIAELSEGRMYLAQNAQPLPQIFARETILASRSGVFERPFTPRLQAGGDWRILSGLGAIGIPRLRGHVVTAAKPLAQTPLVRVHAEGRDPILAYWQVGLGRTVACTTGLWSKWGPDWVQWPGFSKLWTQAVRYAARPGNPGDLEVATSVKDGEAHVSISAEHLPLTAQASLAMEGTVIRPGPEAVPLRLERVATGRFEGVFPVDVPGTYLLRMPFQYGGGENLTSGVAQAGIVRSYSPEYRTLQHNEGTLIELAQRTGGRVLRLDHPEVVFEPQSIRPVDVRRPFWEMLIRLALVVFLLDVAVRRIALTPADVIRRIRQFIHELAGMRPEAASVATLGTLRAAKADNRAEEQSRAAAPPRAAQDLDLQAFSDAGHADADALTQALNNPDQDKPVAAPPQKKPSSAPDGEDYAARLLRAKRRANRKADE